VPSKLRLGVLTPSSNTVLEPATMRLAEPIWDQLSLHFARFRVTAIADEPSSDRQFGIATMVEAARLLADAHIDACLWAGTSGAWLGLDVDRALVDAVSRATRAPATTATLALVDAFQALKVRRYALVVPYVKGITDAIERNLASAGYECVARRNESLTVNRDFAALTDGVIRTRVRAVAAEAPDAIVIHSTNVRGAEVSVELEQELGMPVLDSVVVGLWGALRLMRIETPAVGFGSLAGLPGEARA
jgi:maleate isomerase